jgi:hypothetical protein
MGSLTQASVAQSANVSGSQLAEASTLRHWSDHIQRLVLPEEREASCAIQQLPDGLMVSSAPFK